MSNEIQPSTNAMQADASFGIWDILRLLGQRKVTLFGIPLLVAILVGVYSVLKPPIYSATARVLPPQYNQYNVNGMNNQLGGESSLGNSSLTIKNPSDLYVGILRSTTILDALISRYKLSDYYDLHIQDDVRKKLLASTDVNAGKDGILLIVVEDESPKFAAELANAYVDELYNFSRDLAQKEAARRSQFYGSVLSKAKDRLKAADIALMEVEKRTGFTSLSGQDEAIVSEASTLQESIAQHRAQLQALQSFATDKHPDVILLRSEIADLEKQLAKLMQGQAMGRNTPAIEPSKAKVDEVVKKLSADTNASSATASPNAASKPFVPLGDAPDAMLEHTEKMREVEYWKDMVELLGKYNEMGNIDETRDLSLIQLLDKAVPSHYKSKPKTTINVLLAFVVSWILCFIYLVFTEWLRNFSVQNAHFAEKLQSVKTAWRIRKAADDENASDSVGWRSSLRNRFKKRK